MKKWGVILLIGVALAACSKEVVVEDTAPRRPTAVIESYLHNHGFRGMFASEGTEISRTREEMQRTDHEFKFTGALMKHLSKPASSAVIGRVDKNLLWMLDKKEKRYTECPLGGCPLPEGASDPSRPETMPKEERGPSQPACTTKLVKNDFAVKATGQKRAVNGFDAEEYLAKWEVIAEDTKKMKDTSHLTFTIWTTPETAEIKEVLRVQESYGRAYLQKIGIGDSPMGRVVPKEAMGILAAYFLGEMNEKDRAALMKAAKEFEKIKGFPVSTKVEWTADAKACGRGEPQKAEKKEEKGLDFSGGIGGIMSGLAGKAVEKKVEEKMKEGEGKPIFGYVQEIKKIKVEPVSDSLFQPPAGYKLIDRK